MERKRGEIMKAQTSVLFFARSVSAEARRIRRLTLIRLPFLIK